MAGKPTLKLYNTLTREKADFTPIDDQNVRMYVCGPTVYDFAHIGNARPVIVFDVLNRLLRHIYGKDHVTYVRNITDVDDKINARALRDFPGLPLNDAIRRVTEKTETQFIEDSKALGCVDPDVQPRATENIVQMVDIIQKLIDKGHAYVATGSEGKEVLFSTGSMADYGALSKRKLEDQQAGARVAVEAHKHNPADFVLWKESAGNEPGWAAEFTVEGVKQPIFGRPGWHIECSAMSGRYLGDVFDIHGGGLDLIFPHHENEIAQSRCAHGTDVMANVWMHNGFLQVEGRKMSKSEGNFVTIVDLLHSDVFGGRKWPGEVLRLAMLMTHYREPIDFSVKRLEEAERILKRWNIVAEQHDPAIKVELDDEILVALCDDLDMSKVVARLHVLTKESEDFTEGLAASLKFLGLWFPSTAWRKDEPALQDDIKAAIDALVAMRLEMLKAKNFAEADKIRDQLVAQGIQLKDGKDPATGERITTWEVKR
ncbi:cysteinyl-tRNA synthetase [Pararhizobium capsulatum DSM 1112]|uniref:Cysteine--tRNA ligase n=1 Tax=Pararhizobium capsulatum DSM 1112 TaxID=1121113 RepID=A0ABU0BQI8_9HYPH|nr:cysteine--tRNA ligase [Pararhizobium capsulatum]MDQ0319730.1 cysteinyl-tRNA synthetase [Pararhizobium capsulatum DSM 1112]